MTDYFIVIVSLVTGLSAGILSGLLGIGGGIIFMPVLYYLLPFTGIPVNMISITAVATSLFAGSFSSGSSSLNHFFSKNIDFKKALLISAGCVTSTIFIPQIAVQLDPEFLSYLLIITLSSILIRFLFVFQKESSEKKEITNKAFYPFGVGVGAISSLCGIGGGGIVVPFLVNFSKIEMKKVVGTSSIITTITMISSAIIYAFVGIKDSEAGSLISFVVGIPLGTGALLGARLGVKGANRFSDILLKKIFLVFLSVVIISLLLKL